MATIINVKLNTDGKYEVEYASKAVRYYATDDTPKTVLAWLKANEVREVMPFVPVPVVVIPEEEPVVVEPVAVEPAEEPVVKEEPVVDSVTMEREMPWAKYLPIIYMWLDMFMDFWYDVTTKVLILYDKGMIRLKLDVMPLVKVSATTVGRYTLCGAALLMLLIARGLMALARGIETKFTQYTKVA